MHGSPVEAYVATGLEEAVHLPYVPAPVAKNVAKNMVELFAPCGDSIWILIETETRDGISNCEWILG
jgi:hypothetical protein